MTLSVSGVSLSFSGINLNRRELLQTVAISPLLVVSCDPLAKKKKPFSLIRDPQELDGDMGTSRRAFRELDPGNRWNIDSAELQKLEVRIRQDGAEVSGTRLLRFVPKTFKINHERYIPISAEIIGGPAVMDKNDKDWGGIKLKVKVQLSDNHIEMVENWYFDNEPILAGNDGKQLRKQFYGMGLHTTKGIETMSPPPNRHVALQKILPDLVTFPSKTS